MSGTEPPLSVDSREFSWHTDALCAIGADESPFYIDLWFQEEETVASSVASAICFQCPIRKKCLEQACEKKEPAGIWGGLPLSVRTAKGQSHSYLKLEVLPDPYSTDDPESPFHISKL